MEPYRCPRGPLDLLGHHKNHQDSKTNQQTATTLPTAPKTRRNNSRQYQTHAGRKLAGFRKFKITSTPSMESGRGQGKTAATLIQNTTTNIAPGETKLQREGREVLRALEGGGGRGFGEGNRNRSHLPWRSLQERERARGTGLGEGRGETARERKENAVVPCKGESLLHLYPAPPTPCFARIVGCAACQRGNAPMDRLHRLGFGSASRTRGTLRQLTPRARWPPLPPFS